MTKSTLNTKALQSATLGFLAAAAAQSSSVQTAAPAQVAPVAAQPAPAQVPQSNAS